MHRRLGRSGRGKWSKVCNVLPRLHDSPAAAPDTGDNSSSTTWTSQNRLRDARYAVLACLVTLHFLVLLVNKFLVV